MHESRSFKIFRVVLLTVLVVFTVLPMYTMISTSIKPLADGQKGFSWPRSTVSSRSGCIPSCSPGVKSSSLPTHRQPHRNPGHRTAEIRNPKRRVMEQDHGRIADGVRARGHRLLDPATLLRRRPDRRLGQVTSGATR